VFDRRLPSIAAMALPTSLPRRGNGHVQTNAALGAFWRRAVARPDEPECGCPSRGRRKAKRSRRQIETDRARFLGRGNDVGNAIAAIDGSACRHCRHGAGPGVRPAPAPARPGGRHGADRLLDDDGVLARSPSRSIDKHQDTNAFERAATLAWTQAQVQLRYLDIASTEATLYQRLAAMSSMPIRRCVPRRTRSGAVSPGNRPVAQGISGDKPIAGAYRRGRDAAVGASCCGPEYWRLKGLVVDLVILNERGASYVQDCRSPWRHLSAPAGRRPSRTEHDQGGIFVLRSDLISAETRALLLAVARVVLLSRRGGLADQLNRVQTARGVLPPASAGSPTTPALRPAGRPSRPWASCSSSTGSVVSHLMAGNM